jgi:hypothetical protein
MDVNKSNMPCLNLVPKFYQEIIIAHSLSNHTKCPTTTFELLDQNLWGNKHLSYTNGGKTQCMFSKSFINSNILKVRDLKFLEGKLDQKYIHAVVNDKRSIFKEISLLSKSLKPYRQILDNYTPAQYEYEEPQVVGKTCKDYYKILIKNKKESPRSEHQLLAQLAQENINFKSVYTHKVKFIKNPKLAEFNYKTLHMILPCNDNLRKWGKHDSGLCDICNIPETIFHLLYNCDHAQLIWAHVAQATIMNINKLDIFIGTNNRVTNCVISLIAFLIYKEWLISNKEHQQRTWLSTSIFLRKELKFRMQVYNSLGDTDVVIMLGRLIP